MHPHPVCLHTSWPTCWATFLTGTLRACPRPSSRRASAAGSSERGREFQVMHVYGYFLRLFNSSMHYFSIVRARVLVCVRLAGLSGRSQVIRPWTLGRLDACMLSSTHAYLRFCYDSRAQALEIGCEALEIECEALEIGGQALEIEFLRDRKERVQRQKGFIILK